MFRVPELCKQKGITQKELAARMGIKPSTLNESINGDLRYSSMRRIAKALEVSVTDLFEERDRIRISVQVNNEIHEITESDILEIVKRKKGAK